MAFKSKGGERRMLGLARKKLEKISLEKRIECSFDVVRVFGEEPDSGWQKDNGEWIRNRMCLQKKMKKGDIR